MTDVIAFHARTELHPAVLALTDDAGAGALVDLWWDVARPSFWTARGCADIAQLVARMDGTSHPIDLPEVCAMLRFSNVLGRGEGARAASAVYSASIKDRDVVLAAYGRGVVHVTNQHAWYHLGRSSTYRLRSVPSVRMYDVAQVRALLPHAGESGLLGFAMRIPEQKDEYCGGVYFADTIDGTRR